MIYLRDSAIAMGNFDGVHVAHQKIIGDCAKLARREDMTSMVITYHPHPRGIATICSLEQKKRHIMSLGVDALYVMPFTPQLLETQAEDFVRNILINRLSARHIFCGYNFRFGYKRKGDVALLKNMGEKYGFSVTDEGQMMADGQTISSSNIRQAMEQGCIENANKMLGYNINYRGKVVEGRKVGRLLGFNTANIVPDQDLVLPRNGVYRTVTHLKGVLWASITNIGVAPTVDGSQIVMETHILDMDRDIYGTEITVELLDFIRPEIKFKSVEQLKERIAQDVEVVRRI